MSYEVSYSKQAIKTLARMPKNQAEKIVAKVEQLAQNPEAQAANVKKLQGSDYYRLRVGDYRVIYSMDNGRLTITVVKVGSRGDVYDD